jgi:hypothetical protein
MPPAVPVSAAPWWGYGRRAQRVVDEQSGPYTAITLDACADGRRARGRGAPEGAGIKTGALRARCGRRLSAPWSYPNTQLHPGLRPCQVRGQMVTDR